MNRRRDVDPSRSRRHLSPILPIVSDRPSRSCAGNWSIFLLSLIPLIEDNVPFVIDVGDRVVGLGGNNLFTIKAVIEDV